MNPCRGKSKHLRRGGLVFFALLALFYLLTCVLALRATPVARQVSEVPKKAATPGVDGRGHPVENSGPDAPSGLRLGELDTKQQGGPFTVHVVFTLLSGLAIAAARVRLKFRRFIGLGVFTNWYSALFLVTSALLCGLPQTSVNTVASYVTPKAAPWVLDAVGVVVALLLGTQVRGHKSSVEGNTLPDLASQTGLNVILAVIEDGIRDQILTSMQAMVTWDAHRFGWDAIAQAGERTIGEEVTIGRVSRKEGDAALKAFVEIRSAGGPQNDIDRKYSALIGLLSCCPLSRLRLALAAAPGGAR